MSEHDSNQNGKQHQFRLIPVAQCAVLKRNPQYLTPKTMDALKRSIERDGFVVPILVRPIEGDRYEVVSGNHRLLAAQEAGVEEIPAVVANLTDADVQRLALNLNLVHGTPPAVLLAPFLADMEDDVLSEVFLPKELAKELIGFDAELADKLNQMTVPEDIDTSCISAAQEVKCCQCPTCGQTHSARRNRQTPESD